MANENTGDAGQELVYNKRNRLKRGLVWSDIADKETALRVSEVVKSKVWPRPDYQALVDEGLSKYVVYMVKLVYDSISSKPKASVPTDDKLEKYIEGVGRCMRGVLSWARDDQLTRAWIQKFRGQVRAELNAYMGQQVPLLSLLGANGVGVGASPLEKVYGANWRVHADEIRLIGTGVLAALQPSLKDMKEAFAAIEKGWPASMEAWQKRGMQIVLPDSLKVEAFQVGVADRPYALVQALCASKNYEIESKLFAVGELSQCEAWMNERAAALSGRYLLLSKYGKLVADGLTHEDAAVHARGMAKRKTASVQENDRGFGVDMAERQGPQFRLDGQDVSSETLMSTFGFRGVNFGNWMQGQSNEAERQAHLNHSYDGFMDLAGLLNVPPKAIGLNGMLGLAFGAQGNGSAAAHFVPGLNEINVTRMAGAGAIAHEWAHAMDHSFARMCGLDRMEDPYLSSHLYLPDHRYGQMSALVESFRGVVQAMSVRQMTELETAQAHEAKMDKVRRNLDSWVKLIRRDFERDCPAVAGHEGPLEALIERIYKSDLGEGEVRVGRRMLKPVVAEIRDVYTKSVGRVYSLDNLDGLSRNAGVFERIMREGAGALPSKDAQTTFMKNALELDRDKGGKPYWSTTPEMFARSFEAYAHVALERQGQLNTYLCGLNVDSEKSTPLAEDREVIVGAFDQLFETVVARQTQRGVELAPSQGDVSIAPQHAAESLQLERQ